MLRLRHTCLISLAHNINKSIDNWWCPVNVVPASCLSRPDFMLSLIVMLVYTRCFIPLWQRPVPCRAGVFGYRLAAVAAHGSALA